MSRTGIEQVRRGSTNVERRGCGGRTLLDAVVLPGAVALALALSAMTIADAQAQLNADEVLDRVGERVAAFYKRARNIICIERSTVQRIDFNLSPNGFVRTVESGLHFEADNDRPLAKSQSCDRSGK